MRGPKASISGDRGFSKETEAAIRERLATGAGIIRVAKEIGVGIGTVQRIKAALPA